MSGDVLYPASIDWLAILPILLVTGGGVLGMIIEMVRPRQTNNAIVVVSLTSLFCALYVLFPYGVGNRAETLGGLYVNDSLTRVLQTLILLSAVLTVLFSEGYLREKRVPFGEYYPLLLWSTVGGMIMVATRDLLILFLGLEVLSLCLYVLAGLKSGEKKSQESAMKYFLLGAFASAFMLYGIALIYGATGTTHLSGMFQLNARASETLPLHTHILAYSGMAMVIVGFGFKAAIVPFHMWTPDVYHGAPTSVTAFMAGGSKIAALGAFVRFLDEARYGMEIWLPLLSALAVATMVYGNVVALVQRDAKRILAYSSIAHAGYVLVAIVAHIQLLTLQRGEGWTTVIYYLLAYGVMTVGAFAVLSLAARGGRESTLLDDMAGLWQRSPFLSAMMIVFMASLAGIPPTGGFVGKFLIFRDTLNAGLLWLGIVLALNSVVSAYYYLRIVLAMVVWDRGDRPSELARPHAGLLAVCAVCGFLLLYMAIFVEPVIVWIGEPAMSVDTNIVTGG
jgi:NADH-quinone oxidoreductase subunit N